jgi:hypothetical protein
MYTANFTSPRFHRRRKARGKKQETKTDKDIQHGCQFNALET